ncbi:MAG: Mth938-like domain-containing protein [Ottowia sp.]|nr:Mth938-like domain-containing protein [Ottowia sp.]
MKLHADPPHTSNTITAYGEDYLEVNQQRYTHSLILMPQGQVRHWPITHATELNAHHFELLASTQPELVILGSGKQHHFVHPSLFSVLTHLHIGVETMDTYAACRTYNILMAEGRHVLTALILEHH